MLDSGAGASPGIEKQQISGISSCHKRHISAKCSHLDGQSVLQVAGGGAVVWYTLPYVFCLIIHGKISDVNVSVAYLQLFKLILALSQILSLWMLSLFRQARCRSHPSYIIY